MVKATDCQNDASRHKTESCCITLTGDASSISCPRAIADKCHKITAITTAPVFSIVLRFVIEVFIWKGSAYALGSEVKQYLIETC